MKGFPLFLLFMIAVNAAFAQANAENDAIKKTIIIFFDGMRKADTVLIRSVIANEAVLQSVNTKNGDSRLVTETFAGFMKSVAKPHTQVYDERVTFTDIRVDGDLASVWAPYKFYLGSQFSHCGVDVFQLIKTGGSWKIIYIVDTRRKDNCPE